MPSPRSYPLPPAEMARAFRQLSRVRRFAVVMLLVPPLITGLMVLVHRVLVPGVLDPFLDAPPWPYRFFSGLFYLWMAGWLSLFVLKAFVCPNCGQGFHAVTGFHPSHWEFSSGPGARFNINVATSRCLNCGCTTTGEVPGHRRP